MEEMSNVQINQSEAAIYSIDPSDITCWLISDLGTRSLTRKLGWELCLERISAPELDRLTDSRNTVPPVSWGEGGPPQVT